MDRRENLSDELLRRVVQSRPQPSLPFMLTERIMRGIRLRHHELLLRERKGLVMMVAVALFLMLLVGAEMLCRVGQIAQGLTPLQGYLLIALIVGVLLLELRGRFVRWLGWPE